MVKVLEHVFGFKLDQVDFSFLRGVFEDSSKLGGNDAAWWIAALLLALERCSLSRSQKEKESDRISLFGRACYRVY